jgi:exodeoxyribonuclease V alpha subunit
MIPSIENLFEAGSLNELDVYFAEATCRVAGEDEPLVALGAALVSHATGQGHICVSLKNLRSVVRELPKGHEDWPSVDMWRGALQASATVGDGSIPTPLVLEDSRLYLYRYWSYQSRLARQLKRRMNVGGKLELTEDIDMQLRAIEMASQCGLMVISGGPGTGKTSTVARILASLIDSAKESGVTPPRIRIAAPTGKAAARVSESIRAAKNETGGASLKCDASTRDLIPEAAMTIHRCLGYRPDHSSRFRYNENNPLPVDVMVVDEASMIDLALMTKLIEALPESARLILLGDKDQLASVEAGAVLGDICVAGWSISTDEKTEKKSIGSIVELTHSYRFGEASGIGNLARAVNAGDVEAALSILNDDRYPDVELVETENNWRLEEAIADAVDKHYSAYLAQRDPLGRIAEFDTFRILAVHKNGPGGVADINGIVERVLTGRGRLKIDGDWYMGRPVMATRNDYQLGLFNGDVGLVSEVDGIRQVVFGGADGVIRQYSPSRLPSCETVYAMTVHKSQGSEFDDVMVVLPQKRSQVLTRELLYTAATRAKHKLVIYGRHEVLAQATGVTIERDSGLRSRLLG